MKTSGPPYFLLFLLFGPLLMAQEQKPSEIFDELIALENTDLASGTEYIEQHIIRNNMHKYFRADVFEPGKITYEGQAYLEIPLKYNVYDDLLIIRLPHSGGETIIELHKENIQAFSLYGHHFRNFRAPEGEDSEIGGFYEVLFESSSGLLLKKHLKKISKHLDKNFTYFEFERNDPEYLFFQNNTYYSFDSRRDLFRIFPDSKKLIRRYYRSNRSLSKTDHDQFLIRLFKILQDPTTSN